MSAPPIGCEMRAAIETTAKKLPVRTPICRTSEICAIRDGAKDTNAPLPKPKSVANTIIGALALAGSHSARMIIPRDISAQGGWASFGLQRHTGKTTHDHHHVKAANLVRYIPRHSPSKEGSSV